MKPDRENLHPENKKLGLIKKLKEIGRKLLTQVSKEGLSYFEDGSYGVRIINNQHNNGSNG